MNGYAKSNSAGPIIGIVLIFGLAYAVLRYHIAGPVPWKDFPFFMLFGAGYVVSLQGRE